MKGDAPVKTRGLWLLATLSLAAVLAACSSDGSASAPPAASEPAASAAASSAPSAAAPAVTKIAFFGFWKSNSFTQAVLKGVEAAGAAAGAEVVDLTTPTYDAVAQAKAVQDQTVKGDAQMYVAPRRRLGRHGDRRRGGDRQGYHRRRRRSRRSDPASTTLEPQVDGLVVVGETPVSNGKVLAELAIQACGSLNPCNVAFLEGLKALPLDNARTKSFLSTLAAGAPNATVVADVEGGYTPDQGKKAAQDALQRNPDINVMVGSSQAIIGAESVVDVAKVKLIGNGSSKRRSPRSTQVRGLRSTTWMSSGWGRRRSRWGWQLLRTRARPTPSIPRPSVTRTARRT